MMQFIPAVVGQTVARNTLLVQKASPGLLFGAGIVGTVASTVLACRATLKMNEVLDESKDKLHTAKTLVHDNYSEQDRRRDVSLIYFQTSVKVVRLYGPAVIVGGLSIAALTSSHNILTRRNAALTAAYAALDKGFKEYRARVVAKYGEEEDQHLRYGTREIEVIDPETNKKTKVVRVAPGDPSIYARFFDDNSTEWSKEPEYNMLFLKAQQNFANDLLHHRGHVFLNEVYDMLGLERSKAGAVVGWIISKNGSTDNFINFGVFDDKSDRARDFVNGFEGAILLDFNVDGLIFDKLDNTPREALSWQRGKSLNP
jgi:hypothetical protein